MSPTGGSHLAVTQRCGTLLSAAEARRGRRAALVVPWAARWAVRALAGPQQEEGEKGKRCGPRGGGKKGLGQAQVG